MTPTLSARLQDGKGADRELDREIATAFSKGPGHFDGCRYTSDLNAVFALVERELPGSVNRLEGPYEDGGYCFSININGECVDVFGPDKYRAPILALLASKQKE